MCAKLLIPTLFLSLASLTFAADSSFNPNLSVRSAFALAKVKREITCTSDQPVRCGPVCLPKGYTCCGSMGHEWRYCTNTEFCFKNSLECCPDGYSADECMKHIPNTYVPTSLTETSPISTSIIYASTTTTISPDYVPTETSKPRTGTYPPPPRPESTGTVKPPQIHTHSVGTYWNSTYPTTTPTYLPGTATIVGTGISSTIGTGGIISSTGNVTIASKTPSATVNPGVSGGNAQNVRLGGILGVAVGIVAWLI